LAYFGIEIFPPGGVILIESDKYLDKYGRYRKCFRQKLYDLEEEGTVGLILDSYLKVT